MNLDKFHEYLTENAVSEEDKKMFTTELEKYQSYLDDFEANIENIPYGKILEYTEKLVDEGETALNIIRALLRLADFLQKHDYTVEIIDIIESYNAMDNLFLRLAELHGEELRDQIFHGVDIPPIGADPETKPDVTKIVIKRMEEILGIEETVDILAPCLHGRPLEPIKKDREDFLRIGDLDEFLKIKKEEFVKRLENHMKEGTLEFAQYVDQDVLDYVRNHQTITPGIREGDKIIVTKIPYKIKDFLNTDDRHMKGYYSCYCTWVRSAIKKREEKEISANFCNCSAGFFKMYWDIIFDQSVKVEPIDTPLTGAIECKFAVHIPKEFLQDT